MFTKKKIVFFLICIFLSVQNLFSLSVVEYEMDKNKILGYIESLKKEKDLSTSEKEKSNLNERINEAYDRVEYLNNNGNKSAEEIFKDKASQYKKKKEQYDKFVEENPMNEDNSKIVSDDISDYKVYTDTETNEKYNDLSNQLQDLKNQTSKAKQDYLVEKEGGFQNNYGVPLSKKELEDFNNAEINAENIMDNINYGNDLLYSNAQALESDNYQTNPPSIKESTSSKTITELTPSPAAGETKTDEDNSFSFSNTTENNSFGSTFSNAAGKSNFGQKMLEYSTESRENIKKTIASATWIMALLFFIFSFYPMNQYFAYFKREHGVKQNGQVNAPKITMILNLTWIYFATTFVLYLYLGLVGVIWTNKSFSEMWSHFIQEPIAYLLGF